MRFLVDECTGPKVAQWLRDAGHDVFSVYDESRGMSDDAVLIKAHTEEWVVITNDRDFGEKIYREKYPHRGVIFLRLQNERTPSKISAIQKLLTAYADKLPGTFVVVTETHVRFGQS